MPKKQKILCINDGIIYDSMNKAAKKYGIAQSSVSRQINGKRRTAKGYYFIALTQSITKNEIKRLRRNYLQRLLKIGDDDDN